MKTSPLLPRLALLGCLALCASSSALANLYYSGSGTWLVSEPFGVTFASEVGSTSGTYAYAVVVDTNHGGSPLYTITTTNGIPAVADASATTGAGTYRVVHNVSGPGAYAETTVSW